MNGQSSCSSHDDPSGHHGLAAFGSSKQIPKGAIRARIACIIWPSARLCCIADRRSALNSLPSAARNKSNVRCAREAKPHEVRFYYVLHSKIGENIPTKKVRARCSQKVARANQKEAAGLLNLSQNPKLTLVRQVFCTFSPNFNRFSCVLGAKMNKSCS